MDQRTLLSRVDLVHLERRDCGCSVRVEVESLARSEGMSPVARADIVAFTDMESPGRSKKSVDGANISALFAPAENERLIIRVGQPTAAANSSLNIRGERVVGDRDAG